MFPVFAQNCSRFAPYTFLQHCCFFQMTLLYNFFVGVQRSDTSCAMFRSAQSQANPIFRLSSSGVPQFGASYGTTRTFQGWIVCSKKWLRMDQTCKRAYWGSRATISSMFARSSIDVCVQVYSTSVPIIAYHDLALPAIFRRVFVYSVVFLHLNCWHDSNKCSNSMSTLWIADANQTVFSGLV